jgi:iron complex outermembrane recepter protein
MSIFSKSTAIALMSSTALTAVAALTPAVAQEGPAIEEIMVTATRRSASVLTIPYNISAVSGDVIDAAGITDLGELARIVPGLTFNDRGARGQMFTSGMIIRGMNADRLARISAPLGTVSPVATYVGDTPIFVNLNMMDIERVEVLRGPQGTLYGSGALGGTIRFIQKQPQFDDFNGQLSVGASQFSGSEDLNFNLSGIVNIPVSDRFALRFNARRVDNAGYIDQPNLYALDPEGVPLNSTPGDFLNGPGIKTGERDTNTNEVSSFRAAAAIEPTDGISAVFNYYHQENKSGGANIEAYTFYGQGSKKNAHYIKETYDGKVDMASLEVEVELGFATLSSSTSWSRAEGLGVGDVTGLYENFAWFGSYYGEMPRNLTESTSASLDERVTQELRLVSPVGEQFDWILGAYYQSNDLDTRYEDRFKGLNDWNTACIADAGATFTGFCGDPHLFGSFATTPGGFPIDKDLLYLSNFQSEFEDMAIFGEMTWHVLDDLDLTGGFRAFKQTFDVKGQGGTLFDSSIYLIDPFFGYGENKQSSEEKDVLFKVNAAYNINDDTMIYATWSEGFRRGGANALPPTSPVEELSYAPDTVNNIEAGIKGTLDDRISYTISAYRLDWEDIQINKNCWPAGGLCVVNAGDAVSQGVELEFHVDFNENFRVDAGYAYTNASFETVTVAGIANDSRLPGAPEQSFNATGWYEAQLANDVDMTVMFNGSYRSETSSQAIAAYDVEIDGYWMFNTSVAFAKDDLSLRFFINNLADEDGYMSAYSTQNVNAHWGERGYALRSNPRTVGMSLTAKF